MIQKATFQSIILKLQQFWAENGCLIWQPYYTQVGAGTMNPATFLRSLGPEPWNVAYVEPSVRPDDGRYGENPNRFHLFYQYQVILKPDPGNPQELYLDSLKAVGIDPRRHDIRFVEDNWEQPAISAWGLGWEVWLDGQEITQFTYFQQVGGLPLDPVVVELTYGLERILIALNNAPAIWDEPWDEGVTYGEIRRHDEYEHSKYYFEIADVTRARQMYELFLAEAEACLEQGLVTPAHDYVLKSSHAFNVLDARGAIGVAERQACFRQMRGLARRVAEAYLEQRKGLEYPLLKQTEDGERKKKAAPQIPVPVIGLSSFVLEIGTEELPAGDVDAAIEQLKANVPTLLSELHLDHGSVRIHGTPRRLAVFVQDLSPNQPDRQELVKGPPAERAFDANGKPTKAAEGFAFGKGVDVSALEVREMDGGKYAVAVVKEIGRSTPGVLAEALPRLVAGIKFEKSMRWLANDPVAFSRPIRWLVALLGEQVIPFEYADLMSGRTSRGLRPNDSPELEIASAGQYFDVICKAGIVLDVEERRVLIEKQVKEVAASVKGEAIIMPELLSEVANLVEKPTAVLGNFDETFLSLPREVLISVMRKHQRYFPVQRVGTQHAASLLPHFIAIRNGDDQYLDIIRQGNEHVLGARFADADFFVREDIKRPLESYRSLLSTLIFQTKLGSMLDKADRIEKLTEALIPILRLTSADAVFTRRAAHLAKADLMTQMVMEMTSLQGIMGREYALRSGEAEPVAMAIGELYQMVPQTKPGLTVALADRLDSLVGSFAAGLAPTGAKDPFALRRAALGVVQPLIEHDLAIDLQVVIKSAAIHQPIQVNEKVQAQVLEFIVGRMRALMLDSGFHYDIVDAVLTEQGHDPASAARAVRRLSVWVAREDWHSILPGYARCVRITRDQKINYVIKPEVFVEPAEKALYAVFHKAEGTLRATGSVDDFLKAFQPMLPAVNKFFDEVLVMADDKALRENRLGLLQRISALAEGVADMSKLEGF